MKIDKIDKTSFVIFSLSVFRWRDLFITCFIVVVVHIVTGFFFVFVFCFSPLARHKRRKKKHFTFFWSGFFRLCLVLKSISINSMMRFFSLWSSSSIGNGHDIYIWWQPSCITQNVIIIIIFRVMTDLSFFSHEIIDFFFNQSISLINHAIDLYVYVWFIDDRKWKNYDPYWLVTRLSGIFFHWNKKKISFSILSMFFFFSLMMISKEFIEFIQPFTFRTKKELINYKLIMMTWLDRFSIRYHINMAFLSSEFSKIENFFNFLCFFPHSHSIDLVILNIFFQFSKQTKKESIFQNVNGHGGALCFVHYDFHFDSL